MNRVVYDSVDPAPNHLASLEQSLGQNVSATSAGGSVITANLNDDGNDTNDDTDTNNSGQAISPTNCDNDAVFINYY